MHGRRYHSAWKHWEEVDMIGKIRIIAAAILALVVLVIVLQNTEAVETKLLFITLTMPRAAMLFGTLVIGFVLGVLAVGRFVGKPKS